MTSPRALIYLTGPKGQRKAINVDGIVTVEELDGKTHVGVSSGHMISVAETMDEVIELIAKAMRGPTYGGDHE